MLRHKGCEASESSPGVARATPTHPPEVLVRSLPVFAAPFCRPIAALLQALNVCRGAFFLSQRLARWCFVCSCYEFVHQLYEADGAPARWCKAYGAPARGCGVSRRRTSFHALMATDFGGFPRAICLFLSPRAAGSFRV